MNSVFWVAIGCASLLAVQILLLLGMAVFLIMAPENKDLFPSLILLAIDASLAILLLFAIVGMRSRFEELKKKLPPPNLPE